jgi:hypothetical protein
MSAAEWARLARDVAIFVPVMIGAAFVVGAFVWLLFGRKGIR